MPVDETSGCLAERPASLEDGSTVVATPTQTLAGHPVGRQPHAAVCIGCGATLRETDLVFAYAYRCADSRAWTVPRLFCHGCAPDTIRSPTLGATEVLVGGRLGSIALPTSRRARLCLAELSLRAFSGPTEGCSP